MEEKQKAPTPNWAGCVIFGIINIGFVFLATSLGMTLISTALAILIAVGVMFSLHCAKEDWKAGLKASSFGCVAGFLLNGCAGVLYVWKILFGLIQNLSKIF